MEGPERKIAEIVESIKYCSRCSLRTLALHDVVFRGTPKKGVVMFVGEAPGPKEDLIGQPFVGPSGKMLDRLIQEVGLEEFYVTNVVKHIPRKGAGVRPPTDGEISLCCGFIEEEIKILEPSLIVALGSVALKYLTGLEQVVKYKSQVVETKYGKVFALPHPSYYLRKGLSEYPVEDVESFKKVLGFISHPEIVSINMGETKKEVEKPVFYPLHLHTTYSVGDGYGTPSQYKERFLELGIGAAAITDHGVLGGVVEWTKVLQPEVKPIIGEELYLCGSEEKERKRYHITVLVKNEIGWKNLLRIHYLAHGKYFYYKPRILFSEFVKHLDGLIVLSGCPDTPFVEHEDWFEKLLEAKGGEDVYVEVQSLEKFRNVFDIMVERAEKYKIPVVMTNDVHFPRREDSDYRDLIRQIIRDEEVEPFAEDIHYVLSYKEAVEKAKRLGYPEEWIIRTKEIVDKVEFLLKPYERFPLPSITPTKEFYPEEGYEERWNLEMDRLSRKGYYDFLLLIRSVLDIADELGILYGPGRGSVGGSYVAYRMGIHKANPFEYDLIFDRFLSESRIDAPDIDLDFEHTRQVELIQEIERRFGENKVARVCSWGAWGEKAAVNDLKKFLPANRVSALVPKVVGQFKYRGLHAAGIVVCGEELYMHVPMERSSNQMVTAWDRDSLDYMKIPKIDILGLKTVSLIKEIMQLAGIKELPSRFDDPRVYSEIFQPMKTLGVFQYGTDLMAGVARYATCFEDLVVVNALVRPGASDFLQDWIDLKTGSKKPVYFHEKLKKITKNTLGLILYQEQVMRVVNEIAGLSWEEAEKFRKVTAKTGDRKLLEKYEESFIAGAIKNGFSKDLARKIYDTILAFAGYSFNKSHAVFYSMLGYWTAWLKLYYPTEFYLVSLKYEGDSGRIMKFINEIRNDGYKIVGPSVNKSKLYFTCEDRTFRVGLIYIKGIGQNFAETIVKNAPYRSLLEFVAKTSPNSGQLKALAAVGALDCFKVPRGYLYANADPVVQGSIAFFGSQNVEWTEEQKNTMLQRYLFQM